MPAGNKLGERQGGRKKGTPNKRTKFAEAAISIMERMGFNPIESMVKVAMDSECDLMLRGKMSAELAKYGWAQRRAIEVTGADGGPIKHERVGGAREEILRQFDRYAECGEAQGDTGRSQRGPTQ